MSARLAAALRRLANRLDPPAVPALQIYTVDPNAATSAGQIGWTLHVDRL